MKQEQPIIVWKYTIIIDAERISEEVELKELWKERMRENHYDLEEDNESLILFIAGSCDYGRRHGFRQLSSFSNGEAIEPNDILIREARFETLDKMNSFYKDWKKVVEESDGISIMAWTAEVRIPFCKTVPIYEGYGIDWWEESFRLRSENTSNPKLRTSYDYCHDVTAIARKNGAIACWITAPSQENNSMNMAIKFYFERIDQVQKFVRGVDKIE